MITIKNILDVPKFLENIELVIFDLDDTLYSEKEYVKSGYCAVDPNLADELWAAFEKGEKAFDIVMPKRKEEALNIYRNHVPNISLYPGVEKMLKDIRKKEKKIGVITDGRSEGQRAKIRILGLETLVDKIIITDELGGVEYRKPNRKAFEIMQEYFGVPFEKIIYIGDNINKDFIAPEGLGMKSIFFNNNNGLYYQKDN